MNLRRALDGCQTDLVDSVDISSMEKLFSEQGEVRPSHNRSMGVERKQLVRRSLTFYNRVLTVIITHHLPTS